MENLSKSEALEAIFSNEEISQFSYISTNIFMMNEKEWEKLITHLKLMNKEENNVVMLNSCIFIRK